MELTKRLLKIASYINIGSVVADIGTDHALVPTYLLQKGIIRHAILTDIHIGPLDSAKANIAAAGFTPFCDFYLTDGIAEILSTRPDWYIIAGMGGETIASILSVENTRLLTDCKFVLQPMTKQSVLRGELSRLGFVIEKEELVREDDRIYTVFIANFTGVGEEYSPLELVCGKDELKSGDSDTLFYLKAILKNLEKQYFGHRLARKDTPEEKALIEELKEHIGKFNENS